MALARRETDKAYSAVLRLTDGMEPPEHRDILVQCLSGSLSPAVALMRLLIETKDAAVVRATVDEVTRRAAHVSRATDSLLRDRVDDLTQLLVENEPGCEQIAGMLKSEGEAPAQAKSVEEGIAFCEQLFDWSVEQSEEASVALYSLGNPQLLERATREIIAQLEVWNVLSQKRVVLDIGCGIGRVAAELSPRVREVHGIDVSGRMIDAATRRYGKLQNARFQKGNGRDLSEYEDQTFEAAIAVDTFPYLNQSGAELVRSFFAESWRVLRPGGDLVILNYSSRRDDASDIADVARLAGETGFELVVGGDRPFVLWDGLAFHLRKPASSGSLD